MLAIPHGKGAGQLQNRIRPGLQRRQRPLPGRMHGGHTSLGKAAAHQAQNGRIRPLPANQRKLMGVTPVKGVIFTDNAHNRPHFLPAPFHLP